MAKSRRPISGKSPNTKPPVSAKAKQAPPKVEEPEEDDEELEVNLPPEKMKRPSGKISSRKSSGKSGRSAPISSKNKSAKNSNATRLEIQENRQKKTNKNIIIAAIVIVVLLIAVMFGGSFIDDQRVKAVKNLSMDNAITISDYFKAEPIINVATSKSAGIRKMNKALVAEVEANGPISIKNNLIAGLANTYRMNPKITVGSESIRILNELIKKKDGDLNRKFALQALGFIPGGKNELEEVIKSRDTDADTSLIALNALPKTASGKISSGVLVFALEKNDVDFLKKIFPFVNENIEMFKEETNAVKVLLKNCGSTDDTVSKNSFELLGKCIYKPEHYKILQNHALSEDAKIKENALNSLLGSSPQSAGEALSNVLSLTPDKTTKLKILDKLGNPECAAFYSYILPLLKSNDNELVIAALNSIGKLKNTPDKGLKDVISSLSIENIEVKLAGINAIKGFEYRKLYYYTDTPELIPTSALIKLIDFPDENIKTEVKNALRKFSDQNYLTANEWKQWQAKEKSVLDLLIEMERIHKVVQTKFKNSQFKEAKEEFNKMEKIFNTVLSDHIKQWAGFDKYLEGKLEDLNKLKFSVNKHSPI